MTDILAGAGRRTNPPDLVAVVLAAGEGRRLRPLTLRRPKPLCPVGNVALLDAALARAAAVTPQVAVNVHHGREQIESHLAGHGGVHVSVEAERALGTAGAIGRLRPWIAGRDVVVLNADTWSDADLTDGLDGWDRERPRLILAGSPAFGPRARVVASALPWSIAAALGEQPAELYDSVWRPAVADGRLDVVGRDAVFFDCGTPAAYLAANLAVAADAGGRIVGSRSTIGGSVRDSVVGESCDVAGTVSRSVLWDRTEVVASETLDGAIRVSSTMTVLVR